MEQRLSDFIKKVKKVSGKRHYKVTGSYGVKDILSFYRSVRKAENLPVISDKVFYKIIRTVNNIICDELRASNTVTLPENMGKIYGVKYHTKVEYRNGVLINNHPVDFNKTLKLWYEDPECMKKKVLVRNLDKEIFKLYWDKRGCEMKNKVFYQIIFNRELRLSIRELARQGKYDTYLQ